MSMSTLGRTAAAALASAAVVLSSACSETVRTGRSPAYLIIDEISAFDSADEEGNILASDVLTNESVFEDRALVSLRLALKDIGEPGNAAAPTTNNAITVTRYRVSYRRTDGRNTPGVDVPHAFEGAGTVTVRDTADLEFQIVRLQAKLESPLKELALNQGGFGGANVISTIADVTFFGRDQTGNEVSVTGSIGVNFADWADPE
jgi:hypothetical protein